VTAAQPQIHTHSACLYSDTLWLAAASCDSTHYSPLIDRALSLLKKVFPARLACCSVINTRSPFWP